MSTATRMVRVTVPEVEVPARELLKVLLIDDEPSVRETQKQNLERLGFCVDVAKDPGAAKALLARANYQLIIVDVVFDDYPIEGDQFILENEELLHRASKVIITGKEVERIQRREELVRKGVLILKKGQGAFDETLERVAAEKLEEEKNHLVTRIQEAVPSIVKNEKAQPEAPQGATILANKAQEILVDWLKARKDPERKGIFYAGKEFSPNMLVEEIEKRSDVGLAYEDMFLDLVKHNLRV
jgi:DNA-binding NtrC family response regulator